MIRYTLHVPETLNDGALVSEETFAQIEQTILNIAGGFTITPGIGGWLGESQTYREPVRLYLIDTDEDYRHGDKLHALAEEIAYELEQEAVYLTRQTIETYFVSPARREIAK